MPVTGAPVRILEDWPEASAAHLVQASSNAVIGGTGTDAERGLRESGRVRDRHVVAIAGTRTGVPGAARESGV